MSTIPQTGITTSLVRDTLGETSEDAGGAGNNVGKLCKSSKIKPFNLYKPTRGGGDIWDYWMEGTGNVDEYYQGISTYGIRKPYMTTFNGSVLFGSPSGVLTGSGFLNLGTWSYDSPRGSAYNERFRMGDFRGYHHDPVYYPYSHLTIPLNVWVSTHKIAPDWVPSMWMLYDFEDYDNKRIGLKRLFQHSGPAGNHDMWLGLMMCSANDGVGIKRTSPVYAYYIHPTLITDSSYPIAFEIPMSSGYISDYPSNYATKFIKGENVVLIPFMVINTLQGYRIFPLISDDTFTPARRVTSIYGEANLQLQPLTITMTDSTYIRNNKTDGNSIIYFKNQSVSIYNPNIIDCSTNFSPPRITVYAINGAIMIDKVENFALPTNAPIGTSGVSYDGQITSITVQGQGAVTIQLDISWMEGSTRKSITKTYQVPAV